MRLRAAANHAQNGYLTFCYNTVTAARAAPSGLTPKASNGGHGIGANDRQAGICKQFQPAMGGIDKQHNTKELCAMARASGPPRSLPHTGRAPPHANLHGATAKA